MKIHQFLSQRRPIWAELNAFVDTCAKTRMHQLPLETFQAGSLLYRQTVADLAYLRMRFPEHSALKELEAGGSDLHHAAAVADQPVGRAPGKSDVPVIGGQDQVREQQRQKKRNGSTDGDRLTARHSRYFWRSYSAR